MRILDINIWGGMLHDPLLVYLAAVDADVLCLQEVARAPAARNEWLTYRDGAVELQQRAHLYEEIAAVLPHHDGFFYPTARGQLRDGTSTCWQEFGLATFVRKGFPIIGQALDFIHGRYSPDGFGDHPRSRNALGLKLFDHGTGTPISVVQLHGLRAPDGKGDSPARRAQAEALVCLIRRLWAPGERLVVCGDFNLLPGSETFTILRSLGLVDLVTERGFTDTRTSHYKKDGRYADYMLVTPEVAVKAFDVVSEPEVSDHRPLVLDIG
ncbi:endonuclease/exonuclease/phosphatase family protein [Pararhizobium antarcticum]|uniref:Metal-dependent hydrolase n=1 Tax=Pararhizobium antarcticum TaxID=1798805 RepID=A0A657LLD0_9HYPH|nr:endonuclease/exonuclease/phosphatase family protein [Pararhizobium antarcticum]OJF89933.1 metal-dependent hydrolase [Pararhizobium antarcticum]OJF93233.1 metal-dependent hydrolase [Rhizobium sp. 58]